MKSENQATEHLGCYDEDNDDWAPQRRDPRSPKTPVSRYDEEVRDPVKPSNFFRPNLEPLVEATAAVFHMNSIDQFESGLGGGGLATVPEGDDVSISERSAEVFDHLEQQARQGNHQPFVKFLETASVVSQLLLGSGSEAEEEEDVPPRRSQMHRRRQMQDDDDDDDSDSDSDSDSSDDDSTDDEDDDDNEDEDEVASLASDKVIKDIVQRLGSTEVIDIEKMNAGDVFELLDKVRSVDGADVKEFSSAVFDMLEKSKSFSGQPLDERKVNIFRLLEENNLRDLAQLISRDQEGRDDREGSSSRGFGDCGREDYPEVSGSKFFPKGMAEKNDSFEKEDVSILETPEVDAGSMDGKRSVQIKNMEGDPIDLTFVQDFDEAFNEFIGKHPKYLLKSPDLVHNIRIAKLQKLLAFMNAKEKSTVSDFNGLDEKKKKMEEDYQVRLREAARTKAARQIYFKSELDKVSNMSSTLEAKFKWAVVASAEARTKKQYMMRQEFAAEQPAETREQLLERLPRDVPGQNIMAILRDDQIPSTMTAQEKSVEIRKLQMNIAFLTSEVKLWQNKLEVLEEEKKKVAWVETILQQLSKKQVARLRNRHQKKMGVLLTATE